MPSTTNKGFEVQTTGTNSGTWGSILNDNMISYVDTMLGGSVATSLSSSNVLLSQANARNAMLRFTGTLTGNIVVSPDAGVLMTGFYYFENVTTGSFTVTFTNAAGSVVLPQTRRGVMWVDTSIGPRIVGIAGSNSADPIPVGTVMVFYQNAAPTGWSISTSLNDYALKIVSSSGGVSSGSVAYSTLFSRTTTDDHTLSSSEMPQHQHYVASADSSATLATSSPTSAIAAEGVKIQSGVNAYYYVLAAGALSATVGISSGTGGGLAHSHDIDMRVRTASVILATKG